jgi:MFS family permease
MGKIKKALLLSYLCIASVSAAIITPALPQIERMFNLNHGALEWVVSIFLVGYVIAQLVYGPLSNRFGRLHALRGGLLLNLVGIAICLVSVWSVNYSLLLIGRLVTALGVSAGLCCTFTLINELLPEEKAKHLISISMVSFTIGIALAVIVGGLVTQYWHWQDCFWVLMLHGVLMLAATWQFPETLKKKVSLHPKVLLLMYFNAAKCRSLIVFSLLVGLCSMGNYCFQAAGPLIAQKELGLTASQYGFWNLINMAGMFSSGIVCVRLVKKYDVRQILAFSLLCFIPCFVSLAVLSKMPGEHAIWFFVSTGFLYLFNGVVFGSASVLASTAIADKASASSVMSFLNIGSALLAVMVMGYLPFSNLVSFVVILMVFYFLVVPFSVPLLRARLNDCEK